MIRRRLSPAARGRILSLALIFAAGPAFAGASWPFTRTNGDLAVEVTTYACAEGRTVTLIPTLHYAEPTFYASVERLSQAADRVIYEGVRPAGFFGPPFESDPRPDAPRDPREITGRRLRTVAALVEAFRRRAQRNPDSLAEVFAPRVYPGGAAAFVARTVVDYWGTPLVLRTRSDGRLLIASLGPDRKPGADDFGVNLPAAPPAPGTDGPATDLGQGIAAYEARGRALGLTLEKDVARPSHDRASSVNADVAADMLDDGPLTALRTSLPLAAAAAAPAGTSSVLVYGAGHAGDLAAGLARAPLSCRPSRVETLTVIAHDGPYADARRREIADVLAAFAKP